MYSTPFKCESVLIVTLSIRLCNFFFTYQYLHLLYKSICLFILSYGSETMHEIYIFPDIPQIISLTYEFLLCTSLFLSAIWLFFAFKYVKLNDLLLVDVFILVYYPFNNFNERNFYFLEKILKS